MNVISKYDQAELISKKLNISKSDVKLIIGNYTAYLQERINKGETVKVLNICYIKNMQDKNNTCRETLAYICGELSKMTGMGSVTILRVLTTLEEFIIKDIKNDNSYSIRGLIRVRYEKDDNGIGKVHIKKSVRYNGDSVRIVTLNSFRRKVEMYNAG